MDKYYRDKKVTIWMREYWEFPNDTPEEKVLEAMDNSEGFTNTEYLFETMEEMSIEENSGNPVVEIFDKCGNQIV